MEQILEQQLYDEFPQLFSGRALPISQNLMSFGCECDDGWFNIIRDFCEEIKDEGCVFFQIKEKYGTIRLYMDTYTDKVWENSIKYEDLSAITCEVCGKTGCLGIRGGWYKTLCEECMTELSFIKCKE